MKKNLSFFVIVGVFLVVGLFAWSKYFKFAKSKDTVDIHLFPRQIQDWTAEDLTITEREYEILETRNAFARKYTNSAGNTVFILLVYSQHNRKVSHPPEICYTGGGITILGKEPANFHLPTKSLTIRPNKLKLEQGKFMQVAYYWFKVGDEFTPNYWRQQFLIAAKTFLGQPASSALVRLSATVGEGGEEVAERNIQDFANIITPLLHEYLP